MNETDTPASSLGAAPDLSLGVSESTFQQLQRRVESLEKAVQTFGDPVEFENRIVERVSTRRANPEAEAVLEKRIADRLAATLPKQAPPQAEPVDTGPSALASVANVAKSTWFLFEVLGSVKNTAFMLFDRRYHDAWWTRSVVIFVVAAILTSDFWFPLSLIRYVGWIFDKFLVLGLGCLVCYLLSRQLKKYKEWKAR